MEKFLGQHAIEIWLSGIYWALLSIILVKVYYYNAANKFNLKYWFNDNIKDVILGFGATLLVLRLGDYAFHIAEQFGFNVGEVNDFVAFIIPVSIYIQYKLHNSRKPISKRIESEMHIHNSSCKH